MRLFSLLLCLILSITATPAAYGQTSMSSAVPIQIEADRMETLQEKNTVLFSGHVRATQGDLTINADSMTVRYAGTGTQEEKSATPTQGLSQQIAKITAKNNVKIVQRDWVATGDSMDYNANERIVNLYGNARASQNQNMVSGDKIILYLNEGRSVVESDKVKGDRVKAFIYPGSQEDKQ